MAKPDNKKTSKLTILLVWLFRLLVGATFIISGWAKSIDPWGFIYKIEEYFNVWGLYVPREITLALSLTLAIGEFVIGVLVFVGAMRRASVWLAAGLMAVMLPLTAYIAVANPVSDCGCFGDFIVLSNYATFGKNIALTAMVIYLMVRNDLVKGIYIPGVQWLIVLGAFSYSATLAFLGYRYQPLVDFRPYPNGSELIY
ncbi:MAG: DoxX family protein, partial [Muribaculaceae bacterium]|nr:DoxX family protein [Muribaculaceae bacterium]